MKGVRLRREPGRHRADPRRIPVPATDSIRDTLRRQYGHTYSINVDDSGWWCGMRRDGLGTVTATGPGEFAVALAADYARHRESW